MRDDVQSVRISVNQFKKEIEEDIEEMNKRNHDSSVYLEKKLFEKTLEIERRSMESSFNQIQELDDKISSSIDDLKENISDVASEMEKDAEEHTKLITNLGYDLACF